MAKTTQEYRQEYRDIMVRSGQEPSVFNKAVRRIVKDVRCSNACEEPTPEDYVEAAKEALFTCDSCIGTGMYVSHIENGQPVGNGGICYRCAGKGAQNDADVRRNNYYDAHRDI